MTEILCGICNTAPKKYKCPTCSLPYCSIVCFKQHKSTHPENAPTPSISAAEPLEIPNPAPPAPPPKYLRSKTDFSLLSTSPEFRTLLESNPTLLPALQRIYAATIEPEPDDEPRTRGRGYRGRGWSRGRGRGRGGRGGWNGEEREVKWTPKKGDADAMKLLKGLREGKKGDGEKEAMAEFIKLVEEMVGPKDQADGGTDEEKQMAMDT